MVHAFRNQRRGKGVDLVDDEQHILRRHGDVEVDVQVGVIRVAVVQGVDDQQHVGWADVAVAVNVARQDGIAVGVSAAVERMAGGVGDARKDGLEPVIGVGAQASDLPDGDVR